MISGNYVLDALYGPIRFPDYAWEVIARGRRGICCMTQNVGT